MSIESGTLTLFRCIGLQRVFCTAATVCCPLSANGPAASNGVYSSEDVHTGANGRAT